MNNIREFTSAYNVFFRYFSSGMDQRRTLMEYGMLKPHSDKASVAATWSNLKSKYPDDYKRAREDYLESVGIHKASVWEQVYNIAQNAALDRDRLKALELITKLMSENTSDCDLNKSANRLVIEVVPPRTEASKMNDDL